MSKGIGGMKRECPESVRLPGHWCLWHILDSDIPCRVASQQSPTPFLRARVIFDVWRNGVKRLAWCFLGLKETPCKDSLIVSADFGNHDSLARRACMELKLKEGEVHVHLGHEARRGLDVPPEMRYGVPFVRPRGGSGIGGIWTRASTAPSCMPSRLAAVARNTVCVSCAFPGPNRTAASRHCLNAWRSTG